MLDVAFVKGLCFVMQELWFPARHPWRWRLTGDHTSCSKCYCLYEPNNFCSAMCLNKLFVLWSGSWGSLSGASWRWRLIGNHTTCSICYCLTHLTTCVRQCVCICFLYCDAGIAVPCQAPPEGDDWLGTTLLAPYATVYTSLTTCVRQCVWICCLYCEAGIEVLCQAPPEGDDWLGTTLPAPYVTDYTRLPSWVKQCVLNMFPVMWSRNWGCLSDAPWRWRLTGDHNTGSICYWLYPLNILC